MTRHNGTKDHYDLKSFQGFKLEKVLMEKADQKLNNTKIFGVNWKQIWLNQIVKAGDRDIKKLRIPLSLKQQIFLLRHIEAERVEQNFIERGLSK